MHNKFKDIAVVLERVKNRADNMERELDVYDVERVLAMLSKLEIEHRDLSWSRRPNSVV